MNAVFASFNYALVLLYGAILSLDFSGGCITLKKRRIAVVVIIFILITQMMCAFSWGIAFTKQIYPFISHVPIILFLIIGLKKPVGIAVVSVVTAYFFCQLPRWSGNLAHFLFQTQTSYLLAYSLSLMVFFILIRKYFSKPAYRAMTYSKQSLILFGCLPAFYYLFDYATTVYTDLLYQSIKMINESLPTAMALFYVLFIVMYHDEVQRKNKIELANNLLAMQLDQAAIQIQNAKTSHELSCIYRHDLRHHFALINGFIESGDMNRIKDYLSQVQTAVDEITPVRFCKNDTVNLILSLFVDKAKSIGVLLTVEAKLPQHLAIPDTELCAVLSNGVENALTAVTKVEDPELHTVRVSCTINRDKLLILIQNAYNGEIETDDNIPISKREGHGFGCRSIAAIAEKRKGFCTFKAHDGIFTLRVVLPLDQKTL